MRILILDISDVWFVFFFFFQSREVMHLLVFSRPGKPAASQCRIVGLPMLLWVGRSEW